jgi:pimeloyl-ACP methyl ester carboxylesterase
VLLLHGFPSSSYDFRSVTDRLGNRSQLTLDFLGFGFVGQTAAAAFTHGALRLLTE